MSELMRNLNWVRSITVRLGGWRSGWGWGTGASGLASFGKSGESARATWTGWSWLATGWLAGWLVAGTGWLVAGTGWLAAGTGWSSQELATDELPGGLRLHWESRRKKVVKEVKKTTESLRASLSRRVIVYTGVFITCAG